MDINVKKFIKLRSLLYIYFEFYGLKRIEDLDDFTQGCMTDIESSYFSSGEMYSRRALCRIIENHYYESNFIVDSWGGLEEALNVVDRKSVV